MALTATLLEMRTQVRQRADMVGSNFCTDPEIDGYLNKSITKLYDLLVKNYGEDYYTDPTPSTISVVAGTDTYSLPTTFYKLSGMDVQVGSLWVPIHKYGMGNRNRAQEGKLVRDARYRLLSNKIRFTPIPTASHTVRLWQIPAPTKLVADADTFDGIAGWEEFAIVDAAIKCLSKEESDTSALMVEKKELEDRIISLSANRDIVEAERITDINEEAEQLDNAYVYGSW
jgi:hypothetical protein